MIKICYIVSTLARSGPTNQLYNLIKYLDRKKFEAHLITLSPEAIDSRWDDYENLGIKLHTIGLNRISGLFFAKSYLRKLVEEIAPNLIHTQGIRADILSADLNIKLTRISTVRNFPQLDYVMTYGKILGSVFNNYHIKALAKIDYCCAVSDAVKNNLHNLGVKTPIQTIHNGVDHEYYFSLDKNKKEELRKLLGLSDKSFIWITSLGKDLRKNSSIIAKTFRDLFGNKNERFLIFIGDGQLKSECVDILKNTKNVLFTGRIGAKDVQKLLQISDCFISASKAEGMPNAVLEAMACGNSVLLSDIEPHKEVFYMCENKIGELFIENQLESLCNNMANSTNNHALKISHSLSYANKYFSAALMSKCYQDLYLKTYLQK